MGKKAILVTVQLTTRVIIEDEGSSSQQYAAAIEAAKGGLLAKIKNDEAGENLVRLVLDTEVPYGTLDGETDTAAVETGETKEYEVAMCRIGYAHTTFKVYAKSEMEAETIANEMAGGYEFSEKSSDYEVQSVVATGKKP